MKNKTVKVLLIGCLISSIVFVIFSVLVLSFRANIEYSYEDIVLANTSTVLFPCDLFTDESTVKDITENSNDPKYKEIEKYIEFFVYSEVGNRCPGKFQLEVAFLSEIQRIEIRKILKDQKINGIPVFLRNV